MVEPLISVIIPVYNTEKYVERCVRSVMDNTYSNLEIICVNDGSKDNSLRVLESLAEQDRRIKIIDKDNGGVSSARNAGLDVAIGDYISFIDSDDWVHKSFFDVMLEMTERHGAKIVTCGYIHVNHIDDVDRIILLGNDIENVTVGTVSDNTLNYICTSKLFHRNCLKDIKFPIGIQIGEDHIFISKVTDINLRQKIAIVDLPLYYYYYARENSLTHTRNYGEFRIVSNWYLEHTGEFFNKRIPVLAAIKSAMVYRMEKKACKETKRLLSQCVTQLWSAQDISIKKKLLYTILALSDTVYRAGLKIVEHRTGIQ